jgi:hypothetical protein
MALPTYGVAAAVSDEARYVAVLDGGGIVRVWTAGGEPVAQFQVAHSVADSNVVRFSPGGTYLAAGTYATAMVCPVGAWQQCGKPVTNFVGVFKSLSFSRDERLLAVLFRGKTLVFTLGTIPALVFEVERDGRALAFSPDSRLLAISASGATGDAATEV